MLNRKKIPVHSRTPSEARTAIVAIIIASSLAFLLFQARKDILENLAISEARLALQLASVKVGPGIIAREMILDRPGYAVSSEIPVMFPALPGQITVASTLPVSREGLSAALAGTDFQPDWDYDTRGRFVIRQGKLFASVKTENVIVLTSAPLAALLSGLGSRIAVDVLGVSFLGVLLLLVRESRLSDYSIRRLFNASPVPLFLINSEGRTEFANRAALNLFPQDPFPTLDGFERGLRCHAELMTWLTEDGCSNEQITTREFEISSPFSPAKRFLVARQSFVVRSQQMTIASVFDITVRHEAEIALRRAKEAAETLGRMRSESLAMISHELRTPVNGFLGLAQTLTAQPLPKPAARTVNRMIEVGKTLAVIINDIVDLAMLEAGHPRLARRSFDLQEVIATAVSLANVAPSQDSVRVQLSNMTMLPPYVTGDPARLQQIIINLVGNGIKFTEAGTVTVKTDIVLRGPREVDLMLDVVDTGIGISQEAIPRLFQPFSQANPGHRSKFGGTGLGLAICKRLVDAMGGSITIQSEVGRGSTFRVVLPFEIDQEIEARDDSIQIRGVRVLIVDDIRLNLEIVADMLRAEHCDVYTAESGHDAIEMLGRNTFDLILMDIRMPGMDGLETTAAIRSNHDMFERPIRIVGLTANPLPTDRPLYLLRGIDDVIEKPVERERLRAALIRRAGPRKVTAEVEPQRLLRLRTTLGAERADQIVDLFFKVAMEAVETIADCCSHLNFAEIAEAAHKLSGAASNVGFFDLSESCADLEDLVAEGNPVQISEAATDVIAAFKDVELFVRSQSRFSESSNLQ